MGLKKYFIPSCFYGEIAQLVERGIEDPSVGGSIPSLPTNYTGVAQFGLERPVWARKVGSSNLSIRTIIKIMSANWLYIMNHYLSIISPLYNSRVTLRNMLDSILLQYMNKDFYEVILVDDKSIEEYEDILEDYKHDMNIVFIKNTTKYKGPSIARQCGLDIATGKWVTFIDSDDEFYPGTFQYLFYSLNKYGHESEISCVDTKFKVIRNNEIEEFIDSNNWLHGTLYKLEFIRNHNIKFNPTLYAMEDVWFNSQFRHYSCYYNMIELFVEDCVIYKYILQNNSITHNNFNVNGIDYLYQVYYLRDWIVSNIYSRLKFFKLFEDNEYLIETLKKELVCKFLDFYFSIQRLYYINNLNKDYIIKDFYLFSKCKKIIEKKLEQPIIEYLKNNISLYQEAFNHHLQFSKDLFYEIESLPDWLNRIDNYNPSGKY